MVATLKRWDKVFRYLLSKPESKIDKDFKLGIWFIIFGFLAVISLGILW